MSPFSSSSDGIRSGWRDRVRKAWQRIPAHRRSDFKALALLSVFGVLSIPVLQVANSVTQRLMEQGERTVRLIDRTATTIERAKEASGDDARVDQIVDRARDYVDRSASSGSGGERVDRLLERAEGLLDQAERDPNAALSALAAPPVPQQR